MRETKIIADLYESDLDFGNIVDISMFDFLILQHISYYTKPVVRFQIYEDIVSQLPITITPPKIYYALDKYKDKGLIQYIEGNTTRSIHIKQTDLLQKVITQIFRSLLITYIDSNNNFKIIFEKYIEKLELSLPIGNLLLVGSQVNEIFDTSKYEYLANYVEELSVLVDNDILIENKIPSSEVNYQVVNYKNSKIKESENYFDITLFIGIEHYMDDNDLNQILSELYRVTKSGGKIIINSTSQIPNPKHYLLHDIIGQITTIKNYKPKTSQEINNLISHLEFRSSTIIDDDGVIIISCDLL